MLIIILWQYHLHPHSYCHLLQALPRQLSAARRQPRHCCWPPLTGSTLRTLIVGGGIIRRGVGDTTQLCKFGGVIINLNGVVCEKNIKSWGEVIIRRGGEEFFRKVFSKAETIIRGICWKDWCKFVLNYLFLICFTSIFLICCFYIRYFSRDPGRGIGARRLYPVPITERRHYARL